MSYYLYGIIETKEPKDFGPIGFEMKNGEKGKVFSLPCPPFSVVMGSTPMENFEKLEKNVLIKALLEHQETLEIIMKNQFVLPCKFGTVLKEEKEVSEVILPYREQILEWLSKLKGCCEMNVMATWDVQKNLQEIAQSDPEISALKKGVEDCPLPEQQREKINLGMRLSEKLKGRAQEHSKKIMEGLEKAGMASLSHDLMSDRMVFNASFLLKGQEVDSFYKALEDLDEQWDGELHFKCVGPLPPYSFATVTIKRFGPNQIREALKTLGLKETKGEMEIRRAYKAKARLCHPDTHPEGREEFENINQAYELLVEYYKGGCQPVQVGIQNEARR